MRRILCTVRTAVTIGVLAAVGLALPGGTVGAQTVPNTGAYVGLDCFATVLPAVSRPLAQVSGSREPGMHMYSTGDEIFLHGGPMQTGETYLVYRSDGMVRHPETGASVGEAVNLIARVEVIDLRVDRALALVRSSCIELEVGDPVRRLLQQDVSTSGIVSPIDPNRLVTPRVTDATVVLSTANSMVDPATGGRRNMAMWTTRAAGAVVTIDQGRADGWQLDTPALIYQEHAESVGVAVSNRAQDEPIVIGQGIVFWLEENTAALLITDGDGAVRVGSRARPRRQ